MTDSFNSNDLFTYLGLMAASVMGVKVAFIVFHLTLLCSPVNLTKFKGQWALVTGATDGIGKAFCKSLAKKGLNIVLVSRTQSKLDAVAKELSEEFKVQTVTVLVDFVNDDENSYKLRVARSIEGLEISVLINNVGKSYEMPAKFLEIEGGTDEQVSSIVKCNILSINNMTSLILPQMVERKSGVVINLSSLSGLVAAPLLSAYSGTKAYIDFFTQGLEWEYRDEGITFQCLAPSFVVSNISKIRKPSFMVPTPDAYVKSALGRLGIESRTTGYWTHDLLMLVLTRLPRAVATRLFHDSSMRVRERALKKKAKNQ